MIGFSKANCKLAADGVGVVATEIGVVVAIDGKFNGKAESVAKSGVGVEVIVVAVAVAEGNDVKIDVVFGVGVNEAGVEEGGFISVALVVFEA